MSLYYHFIHQCIYKYVASFRKIWSGLVFLKGLFFLSRLSSVLKQQREPWRVSAQISEMWRSICHWGSYYTQISSNCRSVIHNHFFKKKVQILILHHMIFTLWGGLALTFYGSQNLSLTLSFCRLNINIPATNISASDPLCLRVTDSWGCQPAKRI